MSAVLDTGFTGTVARPATTVAALGLPLKLSRSARLGDGSVREFEWYAAEVEWNGGVAAHPGPPG